MVFTGHLVFHCLEFVSPTKKCFCHHIRDRSFGNSIWCILRCQMVWHLSLENKGIGSTKFCIYWLLNVHTSVLFTLYGSSIFISCLYDAVFGPPQSYGRTHLRLFLWICARNFMNSLINEIRMIKCLDISCITTSGFPVYYVVSLFLL